MLAFFVEEFLSKVYVALFQSACKFLLSFWCRLINLSEPMVPIFLVTVFLWASLGLLNRGKTLVLSLESPDSLNLMTRVQESW